MFVLVVIVVGIVSYFFVRNNTDLLQDKPTIATAKERVDETVIKKPNIVENGSVEPSFIVEQIEEPTLIEIDTYRGLCDVGSTSKMRVDELKALENRSKQQLEAIERVLNKCDQWYGYWDSLSEAQQSIANRQLADNRVLQDYFNTAIREKDKSVLDEARSIVATGGDESVLSSKALSYMLKMDRELTIEIGKRLSIKNPILARNYLKNSSANITSLYGCATGSKTSCTKGSIGLLYFCATSEDLCDLSYEQYVANMTTVNHFADLQQIVSIIRSLVAEGYFD